MDKQKSASAEVSFDRTNPLSIFEFSRSLIGHSLHSLFGDNALALSKNGKGSLGQLVEELFFGYGVNSNPEADFKEAGVELKCTPLLKSKTDGSFRIKERLVCSMIDYYELINTDFEDSHLVAKCRLMLLLFYLHVNGRKSYDYEFLFRVLWELPEKDLILIKKDYDTIADRVRKGEAHLLSEGDTVYLGACRKGHKGDALQKQPNSEMMAKKRAFSLKPSYMRYVLSHVVQSGENAYTNYHRKVVAPFELTNAKDLGDKSFEQVVLERFAPYAGLNYTQICDKLGVEPYQSKSKYADVSGLIASNGVSKRLSSAEEFIKSGIAIKTIRLRSNGMPKEAMSFKNIDYSEILENDDWTTSEAYEIFTNRFLFIVFEPAQHGPQIEVVNHRTGQTISEQAYALSNVFFWTMPSEDLEVAEDYWNNIRKNVKENRISLSAFWKASDKRIFHVRPKGTKENHTTVNPNGGFCGKFCYWLNADYVKQIIDNQQCIAKKI